MRIGLPLAGWQLAVVGPAGEPVAMGQTGELVLEELRASAPASDEETENCPVLLTDKR